MNSFGLLFLFITVFCGMAANGQTSAHSHIDTSMYTIIVFDSSVDMAMDTKFYKPKPAKLSTSEIYDIEQLIDISYQDYNRRNPGRQLLAPLTAYRRQYVAVINGRGQKEVWINFFCSSFNIDWKHYVLIVDDGGVGFFQLRINLSSGKVGELIPNGAA